MVSRNGGFPLCFTLILVIVDIGSSVRIDINPNKFRGINAKSVNVTCRPGVTGNTIQDVVLLEIFKNNERPMALIRQNSQITHGLSTGSSFHAEGLVSMDASQSYLRVMFPSPSSNDTGDYTCVLYFLDGAGVLQEERTSERLTVEDLNDVIDDLIAKVSKLNDLTTVMNRLTQLEDASHQTTRQIKTLDVAMTGFLNKMSGLEDEIQNVSKVVDNDLGQKHQANATMQDKLLLLEEGSRNHSLMINALAAKDSITSQALVTLKDDLLQQTQALHNIKQSASCVSGFSATISQTSVQVNIGDGIPFHDVIMSQGQGFDATSGTYTAPCYGMYAFHLVIATDRRCQACDVEIHMLVNKFNVLATLNLIGSATYTDIAHSVSPQSSISVVTRLRAGDTVHNVLSFKLRGASLDSHSIHSSVFTGYLLNAL